jgi:mono/diheme cytochrome c family protein
MRWLRFAGYALVVLMVLVMAGIVAMVGVRPFIGPRARPLTTLTVEATPERIERGRYLATSVSGCLFCHSETDWQSPGFPVRAGTEGGGKSFADEGVPFLSAPNITPDREGGAGAWTDDMLARAIREGISHDGRALFPMMPYGQYRFMSDEDVASIIAYLRTLKPLPGGPPPTAVPFPVNRLINGVPEPITTPIPQPDRSNQVAYGNYLVRIAVCRDCHTPMDAQGQMVPGMEFAGGLGIVGPYGQIASANITQAPSGIPYYTEDLFLEMMRTGKVRSRDLHDAMPTIVYGTQTDEDLKAMFAYLKTIPPVQHRVDNSLPATLCPRCGLQHGAGDQNQPAGNQE